MEEVAADSVAQPRFHMLLLAIFAALALTLAAVGIYGVMAYSVTQRTQEIGVRMALGAQRPAVLGMILRQGVAVILAGVVFGMAIAWAFTRVLESFLFEVRPRDLASFTSSVFVLITVGLLACYIPARRVTRIDPMEALRHE